ncbi:hypothetical protein TSOC_009168 [Tetrabaena socialis]|uniref:HMG box domain-containing protein n=1 Tax=Tetrabaena socialis TaxID=47790 RepID=A0A2J7ZWK8_9CHLO|nr:hypothetical protein TSOC_009168 [Tetrabaena socialis]|eukprot:PNH04646.1 hypothetical protein TSOC_009168 [Tetrabaena socialis]
MAGLLRQFAVRGALGLLQPVRCLSSAPVAFDQSCSRAAAAARPQWSAAGLSTGVFAPSTIVLGAWDRAPSSHGAIFQLQLQRHAAAAGAAGMSSSAARFSTTQPAAAPRPSKVGSPPHAAPAASLATSARPRSKPKAAAPAPAPTKGAARGGNAGSAKAAAAPAAPKPKKAAATSTSTAAAGKAAKPKAAQGVAQRIKAVVEQEIARKLKADAARERLRAQARKAEARAKLKAKEAQRIRRAPSAYNLFMREQLKGVTPSGEQAFAAVAKRFAELAPADKQKYVDAAAALKARVAELRAQRKADRAAKRALTPYFFFLREAYATTRASMPGQPSKAVVVRLGELWRGLPEEGRAKYVAMTDAERRAKGLPQPKPAQRAAAAAAPAPAAPAPPK